MTVIAFLEAVAVGLLVLAGSGIIIGGLALLVTTSHSDTRRRQRRSRGDR